MDEKREQAEEIAQETSKKSDKKTIALWVIIGILASVVACQAYFNWGNKGGPTGPELGKNGTEIFDNGQDKKKVRAAKPRIGASVPASLVVTNNKVEIPIINKGDIEVVPSVLIRGKEVYRVSRALEPQERVKVVVPVGNASECVTMIESEGGRFSITTKLVR